jgi:hypothetical protein
MNHAIGSASSSAQTVQILKVAAMDLGAGGAEGLSGLI